MEERVTRLKRRPHGIAGESPPKGSPKTALGLFCRYAGGALLLLSACKQTSQAAPSPPPPAEVGILTATLEAVPLHTELPGRTSPFRVAEVRARVNGIVLERIFEEGSDVKQGQLLFRVDPQPYQATLASARAQLNRAQANAETNRVQLDRAEKMVSTGLISQQNYDDLSGSQKVFSADIAGGRAAVQSAQIGLSYTRVVAPIAGRIGRAEVTEGAYVQQTQASLMATIQQIDPLYVDLTQSSTEMIELRRQLESGKLVRSGDGAKVSLLLEDGTVYPEAGTLKFADATVNPTTGSITLRALFPNPKKDLLPGMFVRARLEEGTVPNAILVPQVAVRRNAQGEASVFLVGDDNKIVVQKVVAPRTVGTNWLVASGLKPGDRVVVDGIQKARPGALVKPVAVSTVKIDPPPASSK